MAKTTKRKARREQARREKRMQSLKLWIPIGVFVSAALIFALFRLFQPDLEGVAEFSGLERGHDTSATFAEASLPPTGGIHHPQWMNCGIYDQELEVPLAVHSMEHGAVWMTYNPESVSDAELSQLKGIANNDPSWVLMSPYPNLGGKVVLSAWGKQLILDELEIERVEEFIGRYRVNGPEAGAFCSGGFGTPTG